MQKQMHKHGEQGTPRMTLSKANNLRLGNPLEHRRPLTVVTFISFTTALFLMCTVMPKPVHAQSLSTNHTVSLKDGRVISFQELGALPKKEKEKILNEMPDDQFEIYDKYLSQLVDGAKQREAIADESLRQAKQRNVERNESLIRSKKLNVALDEVFAAKQSEPPTAKEKAFNRERAELIFQALRDPRVGGKMDPASKQALETLAEGLQVGQSCLTASKHMSKALFASQR